MNVIELESIRKVYGIGESEFEALKDLNLNVKEGEFIAILGPSGSGKSTVMNIIGTLDVPTKGKVLLENSDISKANENKLAEIRGKKIGFVFQQFNLIPTLSAVENVALPLLFQNVPSARALKKAQEMLEDVGLGKRLRNKPSQLSGGEQQRVAIARALVNDPKIILADEPTGNLDSKTSIEIMNLLKSLNKKGKTIILITHNKALAKYASKTVNIVDGRIKK
mgnify:CR=1 FL=1